ncbi:MAG: iron-containing alcohol dehydrogenase [Lentisphaeria bacterium]|nr:iron-containing alcohol dehydrogenase [Lentisphaeria bacterium]
MKIPEELLRESPGQRVALCADDGSVATVLAERLAGAGTAVLFTGRHSADHCGAAAAVERAAKLSGCRIERFSDIEPEPGIATVDKMRAFLSAHPSDAVVAAGGGSALDAAKAAYLSYQTGEPLSAHFGVDKYSSVRPESELKRIIALPTTSGTGSECTAYSNIVDRGLAVKKLIAERLIVPDTAIINPGFASYMPRSVTLATGCDALAHLTEGLLNVRADGNHPRANEWALAGIRLVREYLPRALEHPDDAEARRGMAVAAALGGMVIRYKSTGLPHLCSFSWFGRIEHGIAAALLLPASWRYYLAEPSVAERTMMLADVFGGTDAEQVVAGFRSFLSSVGVPPSLAAYPEITPELLRRTASSGRENPMKLELAPRRVPLERSEEILAAILEAAYRG